MSDSVFRLPDVGEGLTEAEIVRWFVAPGDSIDVNDIVVEIETAKAVVELPSPFSGVVANLHHAEGDLVPVGEPLLSIEGEPRASAVSTDAETGSGAVLIGYGTSPAPARRRRLSAPPAADAERPVRGIARAMATAMAESARIPQVSEWLDLDATGLLARQESLRVDAELAGLRVTPVTIVVAAMVQAVRATPIVNAAWHDEGGGSIEPREQVNVGIAVASPRGLVVPVIHDAGAMDYRGIATAVADVTERARSATLVPADSIGGTIAVTNIGVFGVDGGTPLLPPGHTAILAVGRIMERPWVVDGAVVARPVMQLSLTFDHRVVDGAAGSAFLADVARFIADPPERISPYD